MCIVCPGLNDNPGVSCLTSSLALLSSLAALASLASFAALPPSLAADALSLLVLAGLLSFTAAVEPSSLALCSSFPSNQGCAARREACVTKKQASGSRIKNRLTTQSSRFTAPPDHHPGLPGRPGGGTRSRVYHSR